MRKNWKSWVVVTALLVVVLIAAAAWEASRAQECPAWDMGQTVHVYPGDFLDGRVGVVFQPGWWADGTAIYVVQMLNQDGSVYGYVGATGCDLR